MSAKKEPSLDCSREKVKGKKLGVKRWEEVIKNPYGLQVRMNDRGFVLGGFNMGSKGNPENLKKREKGDIKGWSRHSADNLKRMQYEKRAPSDWVNYNVTFTIPGVPISPEMAKRLWHAFIRNMGRKKIVIVWRAEIQPARSTEFECLHWHACVSLHPSLSVWREIWEAWHAVIEGLGEVHNYTCKGGTVISYASSRMALPQAMERSCDVKEEKDDDKFWAYLFEHMSKKKQAQIGQNIGRHWGVVGRKWLCAAQDSRREDLTMEEFFHIRRRLRRLVTPHRYPKEGEHVPPFGRYLGYAPYMPMYGSLYRFGHARAVERLVDWVKGKGGLGESPR